MPEQNTRLILDEKDVSRILTRIAHEVIERNHGGADIAVVGIRRRGDWLARRLATLIQEIEGVSIPVGAVIYSHRRPVGLGIAMLSPFDVWFLMVGSIDGAAGRQPAICQKRSSRYHRGATSNRLKQCYRRPSQNFFININF